MLLKVRGQSLSVLREADADVVLWVLAVARAKVGGDVRRAVAAEVRELIEWRDSGYWLLCRGAVPKVHESARLELAVMLCHDPELGDLILGELTKNRPQHWPGAMPRDPGTDHGKKSTASRLEKLRAWFRRGLGGGRLAARHRLPTPTFARGRNTDSSTGETERNEPCALHYE